MKIHLLDILSAGWKPVALVVLETVILAGLLPGLMRVLEVSEGVDEINRPIHFVNTLRLPTVAAVRIASAYRGGGMSRWQPWFLTTHAMDGQPGYRMHPVATVVTPSAAN